MPAGAPPSTDPMALRLEAALAQTDEPAMLSGYLFGSFSAGRAHRESDVDLAILLDRSLGPAERFQVRLRLSASLPARLSGRAVDVVVLNDAPPHLGRRAVLDGVRVFCRDAEADH